MFHGSQFLLESGALDSVGASPRVPHTFSHPIPAREWAPASYSGELFDRYQRIESVAVVYGRGRMYVNEQNSAARLLRELYRLGRARVAIRAMISERGALDRRSLAALNCYLQHCYAGRSWRLRRLDGLHRWAWQDMQAAVGLRWLR